MTHLDRLRDALAAFDARQGDAASVILAARDLLAEVDGIPDTEPEPLGGPVPGINGSVLPGDDRP